MYVRVVFPLGSGTRLMVEGVSLGTQSRVSSNSFHHQSVAINNHEACNLGHPSFVSVMENDCLGEILR